VRPLPCPKHNGRKTPSRGRNFIDDRMETNTRRAKATQKYGWSTPLSRSVLVVRDSRVTKENAKDGAVQEISASQSCLGLRYRDHGLSVSSERAVSMALRVPFGVPVWSNSFRHTRDLLP